MILMSCSQPENCDQPLPNKWKLNYCVGYYNVVYDFYGFDPKYLYLQDGEVRLGKWEPYPTLLKDSCTAKKLLFRYLEKNNGR